MIPQIVKRCIMLHFRYVDYEVDNGIKSYMTDANSTCSNCNFDLFIWSIEQAKDIRACKLARTWQGYQGFVYRFFVPDELLPFLFQYTCLEYANLVQHLIGPFGASCRWMVPESTSHCHVVLGHYYNDSEGPSFILAHTPKELVNITIVSH